METTQDIKESSREAIVDAWATLQAHAQNGQPLEPAAYRLAFADPEFLLRTETRGIRFQLELLKPDMGLAAAGVHNTVVVYGSARVVDPEAAEAQWTAARRRRRGGRCPGRAGPAGRALRGGARSRAWWPSTASTSSRRTACSSAPAAAPV
jgi:hypothetical protein